MTRRRSSSRCSRKLIPGSSCLSFPASMSGTIHSGSGSRSRGRRRSRGAVSWGGYCRRSSLWQAGNGIVRRRRRRRDFLLALLGLELPHLVFQLPLQLVGSAPKLGQGAADLAAYLRHLLRPKQQQGEKKQEKYLRKAEIHGYMILAAGAAANAQAPSGSLISSGQVKGHLERLLQLRQFRSWKRSHIVRSRICGGSRDCHP